MTKKLEEALKTIKIKCHPNSNPSPLVDDALEVVEQALKELDDIKNSEPSEALEDLDNMANQVFQVDDHFEFYYNKVKQYILKAQENKKEIAKYKQLEEKLGCPLEKLIEFSNQSEIYTKYGVHTNEIVLIDFCLNRIHITENQDLDNVYTLNIDDYKKTWWLKENKEE